MELRQLETFLVVANELHFTRAARRLHLAQSSVSAQIRALEESLDVRLFDRVGRDVMLTDAGEKLRDYARRILDMTAEIRGEVQGHAQSRGSLTIRVPETLATEVMPEVVERYRADFPLVRLDFCNCTDERLAEQFRTGRLDLAFLIIDAVHIPGVNFEMLRPEPLALACAPGHPLADLPLVTPEHLDNRTLLLPRTD